MLLNNILRKAVVYVAVAMGTLVSPAVLAIKNQVCPNCTPDRMLTAARAYGTGTIYIWDPYNGDVHKYVSYCGSPNSVSGTTQSARTIESAPSPYGTCGTQPMTTDEYPVEQEYADVAPHLGKIWVATNGTWVIGDNINTLKSGTSRGFRVPLPIGFGGYYPMNPTVQDFMTDFNLRTQVQDYVDTSGLTGAPSFLQAAVAYLRANINATMAYTGGIVMNFEVVFKDGSSVVFTQPLTSLPNYVTNSGRDSVGFGVPEANSANYAGNWNYDPQTGGYARGRLIDLLQNLNAQINYLDAHGYRISCTWNRHTLACTVRR